MNNKEHDAVLTFDTLFTTNHIRMLKIIMPYFEAQTQKTIAIYIKFLELQYAIAYHNSYLFQSTKESTSSQLFNFDKIFNELTPYCSLNEKNQIEKILNLLHTFQNYENMMETMNMMKEFFPDGFPFENGEQNNMDFNQISNLMQMFTSNQET